MMKGERIMGVKKGDKFIIEIDEIYGNDYDGRPKLYRANGMKTLVFDKDGLDKLQKINSVVTAEEGNRLFNEAYEKGYKDGSIGLLTDNRNATDYTFSAAKKLGYDEGLKDAWKAARKIMELSNNDVKRRKMIGDDAPKFYLMNHTAEEAIKKIDAYEAEQKKVEPVFRVGDRVRFKDEKIQGIICSISTGIKYSHIVFIMKSDGSITSTTKDSIEHIGGNALDDLNTL